MRIEGPVLALDSSTSLGSVAVGDARGVYGEVTRNVAGGHSSALLPAVQQVMGQHAHADERQQQARPGGAEHRHRHAAPGSVGWWRRAARRAAGPRTGGVPAA